MVLYCGEMIIVENAESYLYDSIPFYKKLAFLKLLV